MKSTASSSGGISTYRDRTSEFHSLSQKLKKNVDGITVSSNADRESTSNASTSSSSSSLTSASAAILSQSDFKRKASRIGLGVYETSQKIFRLAQLSKKSSMFDDPLVEIQELTALIKNDITSLNMAVSDLQTLQNLEVANENCSKDRAVHATTICDDLKTRLMGTTKQFQDVLTTRTKILRDQESRKQRYSTNASREKPFLNNAKPLTEPPPWSNASDISPPSTITTAAVQNGNQLRRRSAVDTSPSHSMEVSMLQQVIPRQEDYMQNRASALQNVESTISELGGIFTQLATMVAQQGELAIRIDDNMDESLSNVEGARSALLKHLTQISSNRWLLIKIFAVLIFFLLVFVFFVV